MDAIALLGLFDYRQLDEGSAPVVASLWLRTFRADPLLAPFVPLPLLMVRGIIALATAQFAAVIVAMDCMRRLTFEAIRRARRGRPSFVYHAFWSISFSTSFTSGSYTEPLRLLRKYNVENGDFELSTQIVKEYGGELVVSQWMRIVFSEYQTTSFTFLFAKTATASSTVRNLAWKCTKFVIRTRPILHASTSSRWRNSQYSLLELSSLRRRICQLLFF